MGGRRGTDVARDSADLVLLDDSFSSIVEACRLGRKVYNNISKAVMYVIIVHIPFAGLALLPVLFKWPLLLYPVHIVFAELLIDPACSIVFEMEPEESDLFS
jgi:Ca2+-transporting ATPase